MPLLFPGLSLHVHVLRQLPEHLPGDRQLGAPAAIGLVNPESELMVVVDRTGNSATVTVLEAQSQDVLCQATGEPLCGTVDKAHAMGADVAALAVN